jgi:ABC-type uncharacterized transport system involved in gliding motility auxiliary subunit
MSKLSKFLFLAAFLLLVATFATQLMTGLWLNANAVMVWAAAVAAAFAMGWDWRFYVELFTMRTTKHGMNMGVLILVVITLLVCVNYLANKHNVTWDVTKEKLNSLSDQSAQLVRGLKQDLTLKIFYKGPSANEEKQRLKTSLHLFEDASSKLKVQFINAYVDQQEAIHYLSDQPDRDTATMIAFAEYGSKKVRIEEPFDEAAITSALIKVTREGETKVYFLKGHGEREIDAENDQGLKDFAKALGDASIKAESLVLIDKKEIPADAAAVAIVGPSVAYLDSELEWLRAYIQRGGHLFIALDPGQRQNLANLTKSVGVEFENNYVITMAPIVGGGQATILGRSFDASSDVTKSIPSGASFAVFPLASEVRPSPDKSPEMQVREIVKSDRYSFTMPEIKQISVAPPTKPITLAVESSGGPGGKSFSAVVFGDSDFISNRGLMLGVNRDLGLNAIAALAGQKDLLSIRPKLPKGSTLTMTAFSKLMVIVLGLSLPVLLLITSGVMWFRRRGA